MTFEEWFTALYVKRGFVSSKDELREAWEEATKAEREACAKACEEFGETLEVDVGPNFAEHIRAR
jgi:hypothetical protein